VKIAQRIALVIGIILLTACNNRLVEIPAYPALVIETPELETTPDNGKPLDMAMHLS